MNGDITPREWKLINQCAKKEYQRLHARTNLSLEWFINAGYVGLIDRRRFLKRWTPRYVWLSILSGIRDELRREFDRRRQRNGTYRTMLTFSDLGGGTRGSHDSELDHDCLVESTAADASQWNKDSLARELWADIKSRLTGCEFRVTQLWAEGYTNAEAAELTSETVATVRYRRALAIKKLQGEL